MINPRGLEEAMAPIQPPTEFCFIFLEKELPLNLLRTIF
jgi:hypothetical protein